jgi:CDP-diglyceride synthetase
MSNPIFAMIAWEWSHQLAIFLVILLLTFYSVVLRAYRAYRERKPFPIGSLVMCSCLIFGFVMGASGLGEFGAFMAFSIVFGILAGGLIGMFVMLSRGTDQKSPETSPLVGVWDRELDQ